MSAVFSSSKKAWKKTTKPAAQINTDQEKGMFTVHFGLAVISTQR